MDGTQHRKITRNRELRACIECRKRKLKCDRQLPCASCVRRNEASSCFYEKKFEGQQNEHVRRMQAEAKLAHLEQMVQELRESQTTVPSGAKVAPDANLEQNETSTSFEQLSYTGATHWSAMLEDIEELRLAIGSQDHIDDIESPSANTEDDAIGILFGAGKSIPFQDILQQFLPPKQEVDRFVAAYFRAKAIAAPFIHTGHFSRLYQQFWDNTSVASPLWTSILFSILHVASRVLSMDSAVSVERKQKADQFAVAAAHCLAVGEYYRPQRFTVEALLLFAQSNCFTTSDVSQDVAVLFGTIVRVATNIGYHKDADGLKVKLSPFEAEMRRRTWSMCMQVDLLVSFQLGLPSNVQSPTWDTKPPTNLLDSDFDENSTQLPPARPDSEPTEILFYITKHRLMAIFEKVMRHALSTTERPSEELESIDQELRIVHASTALVFQPRLMADSIADPPSVTVTRLCVEFIYQKCLCVLHRRYVIQGRWSSIETCSQAASQLVKRFIDIIEEFEPGGQLETERWFMGSITWHDFLLGCTVLCLTVCSTRNDVAHPVTAATVDITSSLELLQNSKAVFGQQLVKKSKDTQKVVQLIDATLMKFDNRDNTAISATHMPSLVDEDMMSHPSWLTTPSFMSENEWLWNEPITAPMFDDTWAFLGDFLDLPDDVPTGNLTTDTTS